MQAEAGDTAKRVEVVVRALEEGGVVELRICGKTMAAPVFEHAFENPVGAQDAARPGARQRTVQGHGVENLDVGAADDDEPLDAIETIEFGLAGGDLRKIPTTLRRRSPGACPGVEQAAALEYAGDGAHAGHGVPA